MKALRLFFVFAALVHSGWGQATDAAAPELVIERETRTVYLDPRDDPFPRRWVKRGENLFEIRALVRPNFVTQYSGAGEPVKSAQKVFESRGVKFEEGASAKFDPEECEVIVINTAEQIEMAEIILGVDGCVSPISLQGVLVELEIYEIPSNQLVRVLASCSGEGNHTPERNAVANYVSRGGGTLVKRLSTGTMFGTLTRVSDAYQVEVVAEADADKDEGPYVVMDTRTVGTELTLDPLRSPSSPWIDLSVELQHHTAPPIFSKEVGLQVALPTFHCKTIRSHVKVKSGHYLLLGNWTPTGKPEYENSDLVQVAFIKATTHNAGGLGQIEPADGESFQEE